MNPMDANRSDRATLTAGFMGFWMLAWTMSGLEKALFGVRNLPLGPMGRDDFEHVHRNLHALGLPGEWAAPALKFAGAWEIAIAAPIAAALMTAARLGVRHPSAVEGFRFGMQLSLATLAIACALSGFVGARADAQAAVMWLGLLGVTAGLAIVEGVFGRTDAAAPTTIDFHRVGKALKFRRADG